LCLKAGEVLETANKKVVLSDERIDLGPEQIGGWIRHHGWTLHVDPTSRLTWPVYPFNPYRNAPETGLAHAVGALSTPLKVKDQPGSQFRTQDISFKLETSADQSRRAANDDDAKELPYDRPIKKYLAAQAEKVERELLPGIHNGAEFDRVRPAYREQYLYML